MVSVPARQLEGRRRGAHDRVQPGNKWTRWQRRESSREGGTVHSWGSWCWRPAQCTAAQASVAKVAKVAMLHGLNANLLHGWRKLARERDGAALLPSRPEGVPVNPAAITRTSTPQFVPMSLAAMAGKPAPIDIQIERRRGATAVKITGPISAAADCAA